VPDRVERNQSAGPVVGSIDRFEQEKTLTNERQDRAARAEQMRRDREKADKRQRNVITIAIVVVVLALIAGGGFAIKKASDEGKRSTKLVAPKNTTKDYGIVYDTKTATGKAAKDPVTVTLYEDFQCPSCKAFEEANGPFLKQAVASGDISIEFRPISFLDSPVTDDYSSRALNTALCLLDTTDVKTYAGMHDLLYLAQSPESGPGLDDAKLAALAKQAGAGDLKTCMKSRKFDPWLRNATKAFDNAKYSGTPTILVDGKKVDGPTQNGQTSLPRIEDLQKAIAAAKS
jgi:protein-disulfide isomerase